MKLLRNREIVRDIICYLVISVMAGVLGGLLFGVWQGIFGSVTVIVGMGLHLWQEKSRYRRLAVMSDEIDRILHGEHMEILKDCEEGELAILTTQLNKMVYRLKEQAEKEKDAKIFLSDAMADISHQIKTPLTSMNLVLSFLRENDMTEERRIELARELSRLTAKIEWLIYALLRLSKLDAGTVVFQKERISLKKLLDKVYENLSIPLELKGIRWECHTAPEACISCDAAWMEEAIGNVVKNCMEHTRQGGRIIISAEENSLYSSIVVQDDGKGIDPEDLPHIFERFYRGKKADKDSVGIGLALTRKIVKSQNGTVAAKNRQDGQGAEFEMRIYKTIV